MQCNIAAFYLLKSPKGHQDPLWGRATKSHCKDAGTWRGIIRMFLHSIYYTIPFSIKSNNPNSDHQRPSVIWLLRIWNLTFLCLSSSLCSSYTAHTSISESLCLWSSSQPGMFFSQICLTVSLSVFRALLHSERGTLTQRFKISLSPSVL